LSSIESEVIGIEEGYAKLLKEMESYVSVRERNSYGFAQLSEDNLLNLLRNVMSFQRKIECAVLTISRDYEKSTNIQRIIEISKQLISFFNSGKEIGSSIDFQFPYGGVLRKPFGIVPQLKEAHNLWLQDNEVYRQYAYCTYRTLKLMKSTLIEFEEEMRQIAALTTYPIANKIVLKNKLVLSGFEDVAISLEEAETNTEINHFKDAVSRCRDAVEILIAKIREQQTGEKTEKSFSTDFAKLQRIGVFDDPVQRLSQGVYSYLSLKGSHKYDAAKVTIYDAETSLKETYSLIEMLIKKLAEFKKTQESAKPTA
jgi:hypothetical protein